MFERPLKPVPISAWERWIKVRCWRSVHLQIVTERLSLRSPRSPNARGFIGQRSQSASSTSRPLGTLREISEHAGGKANSIRRYMRFPVLQFISPMSFQLRGSRPGRLPLSSSITRVVALDDTNKIQEQDTGNYKKACLRHGAPLARYSLRVAHA